MNTLQRISLITLVSILVLTGSLMPVSVRAQSEKEEIGQYLAEVDRLAQEALEASQAAENGQSVDQVKAQADKVFETVWGMSSGLLEKNGKGAANMPGWKVQWQVTFSDFDSTFAARYGSKPPEITDPGQLGITGRGRYIRRQLATVIEGENTSASEKEQALKVLASLNNVIGWMKMDDGVTKGELQPRVDLTREWDSPSEFWLSTSDTGWLHEVASQAINILKTDYDGDVETARQHAAAMTELVEKYINGVDSNNDGTVEAVKMEGGLQAALNQAKEANLLH